MARVGGDLREMGGRGLQIANGQKMFICLLVSYFSFIYGRLIGCFRYNLRRGFFRRSKQYVLW